MLEYNYFKHATNDVFDILFNVYCWFLLVPTCINYHIIAINFYFFYRITN